MATVNVDNVLYGNPTKRLLIARNAMKENYTMETANEYMSAYIGQPLSFILENSRMIFSEPYYGYDFYKKAITESALIFPEYENELEKVRSFTEEYSDSMSDKQKSMFEDLQSILESKCEDYKNSTLIYNFALESGFDKSILSRLADKIYDANNFAKYESSDRYPELCREIGDLFTESVNTSATYSLLAPYVAQAMPDISVFDNLSVYMPKTYESVESWGNGTQSMLFTSKLSNDKPYKDAVNHIVSSMKRIVFESYMESDLNDVVRKLKVQTITEDELPNIYESSSDAVDSLFDNDFMFEAITEDSKEVNTFVESTISALNDSVTMLMYLEYASVDDVTEEATGYDFFSEGATIEDCLDLLIITEATVPVVPNKDGNKKESLNKQAMNGEDNKQPSSTSSKPVNPKKDQDITERIQYKAMDIEAKQTKQLAEAKRKGSNLKNAAKAVTNIPGNIIKSFKDMGRNWEEADKNRRKKYMVEPGYRKKVFRNIRLALTYGALGHIKLLFVPAFAIVRHFSKSKDRRVRNELMRELETDLKITREKINDANANNDQKAKYQLMRIESQIEAELVRVKLNSKTV